MARLDDLVAQVSDPRLRQELAAALKDLKQRQRFGLVFEEHQPETTALYGLPIQVGSLVQRRDDTAAKILYRVASMDGHQAPPHIRSTRWASPQPHRTLNPKTAALNVRPDQP